MIIIKAFRIITVVLLIAWMLIIFSFSAENSNDSDKTSGSFIKLIAEFFHFNFDEIIETDKENTISSIQHIIRKLAHFFIFAVLGALAFLSVISYTDYKIISRLATSALICLIYAISDEVHQLFVPGRSSEIRDVFIDFSGSLLAITVMMLFCYLIKPIYRKIKQQKFNLKG